MDHLLRATARAETRHFWFRGFRAFIKPLLEQAAREHSGAGVLRILDCGCGTGANLAVLNRYGRAFGIDFSAIGLGIGRRAGRTLMAQASVAAVPFASTTFDIVTSFDVLYSLDDRTEAAAIAEMFRVLKPRGYALVNVAAMEILRGDHSVLSHEIRRYSRAELRRRLESAGFAVQRLTYTNFTLFLPMLVVRALQRRRGLKPKPEAEREITVPPAPINALLSALLLGESLFLRGFDAPAGSSLLCLARKP